jgi:hypothetical protein
LKAETVFCEFRQEFGSATEMLVRSPGRNPASCRGIIEPKSRNAIRVDHLEGLFFQGLAEIPVVMPVGRLAESARDSCYSLRRHSCFHSEFWFGRSLGISSELDIRMLPLAHNKLYRVGDVPLN